MTLYEWGSLGICLAALGVMVVFMIAIRSTKGKKKEKKTDTEVINGGNPDEVNWACNDNDVTEWGEYTPAPEGQQNDVNMQDTENTANIQQETSK